MKITRLGYSDDFRGPRRSAKRGRAAEGVGPGGVAGSVVLRVARLNRAAANGSFDARVAVG
jgi:hypothetical protein